MCPLTEVLKGNQKKLTLGEAQQRAFDCTKSSLSRATTLADQDPDAPLTLTTDASNNACGAVLEQLVNDVPMPQAFFSRKLKPADTCYSTFDRELLAVYQAVRHFKYLLEGVPFTIRMDHQPLVHTFIKGGDAWSARQQHHLAAVSEFRCSIKYVTSRRNSLHLGVDYKDLALERASDPKVPAYQTAITALRWEDSPFGPSKTTLLCDTSTCRPRPLIPASQRKQVFDVIHGLSHPLPCMASTLMTERHLPSTQVEIRAYPRQRRRALPPSDNTRYLLTVIDQSTKWPEATPISEGPIYTYAEALLSSWISRFRVPDDITTDRGTAFTSELWTSLARLMGTKHHMTMAYNPAANGMVERTHYSLKASLMTCCTEPDWKAQPPWVPLGLRTTPRANGNPSLAEKVYGKT
ncbi:uncharacterized protein LOC135208180 [Macrobrachium nipponense]|uniref:uncharacterized protein LOC135208180 n=1 Tax=Macrobrachium nipponense TaxID=159736 RepID=UPI0030C8A16F